MGEAQPLEEFQGAIDGRRFGRLAAFAVGRDQVIGLQRPVTLQQQLQHPAAWRRQSLLDTHAMMLGRAQGMTQVMTLQARMGAVLVLAVRSVHVAS